MFSYYKCLVLFGCLSIQLSLVTWGEPLGISQYGECMLYSAEQLQNRLVLDPEDSIAKRTLADLDLYAEKMIMRSDLKNSHGYYFQGYRAYRAKEFLEARNAWVKFIAFQNEERDLLSVKRKEEVCEYLRLVKEFISPAVRTMATPVPSPTRRKPRIPAAFVQKADSIPPHVSIGELLLKASQAKDRGQFERAWRLYQMALQLDPKSSKARQELVQLEEEMN